MISFIFKFFKPRILSSQGNILVYIVMTMVIFGVLGVTMVSLFSTSITSSATQNDTRRAAYLSEAGIRYAMSELLTGEFSKTTINDLNTTVYNINPAGRFDLNIFSPWFEPESDMDLSSSFSGQTRTFDVQEGNVPNGFINQLPTSSTGLALVNYDYIDFGGSSDPNPPPAARAIVTGSDVVVGDPLKLQLTLDDDNDGDGFVAGKNETVAFAVQPFSDLNNVPLPANILLQPVAAKVFPARDGVVEIKRHRFYYEHAIDRTTYLELTNLRPVQGETQTSISVTAASDYVTLNPRNRYIISDGISGEVHFGNHMNYASAMSDISLPASDSLKPDIEFDEEASLPGVLSQAEQNINVVNVGNDPGNKYLSLSASGGSFGAVWFQDTRSIGGIRNFCQAGGCLFNIGFRAFFIMNFSGADGDGFTFSILNRSNNDIGSVGGDISLSELLAYAGDSRTTPNPSSGLDFLDGHSGLGLQAPKMAVEFDGRRNTLNQTICQDPTTVNQGSRFDPDFSGSDRDVVQYVFWGKDSLINAPCRINTFLDPDTNKTYDDNRHDTVNQIWAYDSGSRRLSSPAVDGSDPANVKIYTGRSSDTTQNDAGRIIRLNPSNGTTDSPGWERNPDTTSGNDDDIDSSPALDSSGNVYIGNDSALISRYNSDGSKAWSTALFGNIEGKPFVSDVKDRIYVVTDKNASFNAMLVSVNKSGAVQWFGEIGTTDGDYTSSPVVRYDSTLDKNIIYVGSLNRSLYVVQDDGGSFSIVRQFSIPSGPIRSTPAINPVTNDVYFGSDDNNIYAVTSAGNGKWAVLTGDDVVSSPAVTSDGRTVYAGSDNGRLYIISLNADGTLNSTRTYPPTGDSPIGPIRSSPTIASDGAIIFGSDDGHLYTLNSDGTLRWKYPAVGSIAAVRSKPAIGPDGIIYFGAEDGKLYAIDPAVNDPKNIPNLYLTPTQLDPLGLYGNNWFTEGPWAVRVEVQRSTTPNGSGKYEYTLKTWMKKCDPIDTCLNAVGGFFQNTRFEYDWVTAGITPMTQTIELSNESPDLFHDRFDRFLFGFTSASTAAQTIEIRKFQLSFIRPNDPVAND
jgi:outer membrane protein assembly factor BamB